MAVADYDDFLAKLKSPFQVLQMNKNSAVVVAGRQHSHWLTPPFAGAAPTTAAAPTMATVGAIDPLVRIANPALNAYLGRAEFCLQSNAREGTITLCDRLSHQGGLDATVTTAGLTTNLPTAALTRYTDGVGVEMAIEIHSAIGATPSTIVCSYTNEAGTGGRTSPAVVLGGGGYAEANRFIQLPLQAGDTGVRSIESSTLAGTTGTAGAFGYTLFRKLATFGWMPGSGIDYIGGLNCGNMSEIIDDACLFWLISSSSTGSGAISGRLTLIEA